MASLSVHHVIAELTVGGAETLLACLAEQQLALGFRVTAHALLAAGHAARRLESLGVHVLRHRPLSPLAMIGLLYAAFRRDRPHVVHCHNIGPAILAAPAARLASVPVVIVTRHGGDLGSKWTERKFWLAARLCDSVVAVSRSAWERFASAPWSAPAKLAMIYNGTPLAKSPELLSRPAPGGDAVRLVSVARLNPIKDFPTLLHAMTLACQALPSLRLAIVGDGSEKARLLNLIHDLRLEPHVALVGEQVDIAPWLAQSDIFVLSSVSEGLPVALLEAMAMGLPSIVTSVGGMPEVVGCCGSGLLVPPRDPASLASAILQVATDPKLRLQLGEAARRCHQRHFSAERMASQYVNLYQRCLDRRSRPWGPAPWPH